MSHNVCEATGDRHLSEWHLTIGVSVRNPNFLLFAAFGACFLDIKEENCKIADDCTAIAIHIRAGDYGQHLDTLYGYKEVLGDGSIYLKQAMDYFARRNSNHIFYVLCQETERAKAFMEKSGLLDPKNYRVGWPGLNSAGVDFSLISLADNVIYSYGTYGFIAAIFYCEKCGTVLTPSGYDETHENLYIKPVTLSHLKYL